MLKSTWNRLLNILFPRTCISCHNYLKDNGIDNSICYNCWRNIKKNVAPFCRICGKTVQKEEINQKICRGCQKQTLGFDRAFSPCVYTGIIREIIHKFKYQNKDYLSPILAKLLVEFIRQYRIALKSFDLIIPIPLYKARMREREFNQAQLLANHVACEFLVPLSVSNLWRKRQRQAQMELEEKKRWRNIKDCFALRNPEQIKDKRILLIDDVLTTGATCSEAAFVLKAAGASNVTVLTLAN